MRCRTCLTLTVKRLGFPSFCGSSVTRHVTTNVTARKRKRERRTCPVDPVSAVGQSGTAERDDVSKLSLNQTLQDLRISGPQVRTHLFWSFSPPPYSISSPESDLEITALQIRTVHNAKLPNIADPEIQTSVNRGFSSRGGREEKRGCAVPVSICSTAKTSR